VNIRAAISKEEITPWVTVLGFHKLLIEVSFHHGREKMFFTRKRSNTFRAADSFSSFVATTRKRRRATCFLPDAF
jgi:hypothetical protein